MRLIFCFCAVVAGACLQATSYGVVVEDDVLVEAGTAWNPQQGKFVPASMFGVKDYLGGGPLDTSVWINATVNVSPGATPPVSIRLNGVNYTLDGGSDWFYVHAGDVLDWDAVKTKTYPSIVRGYGSSELHSVAVPMTDWGSVISGFYLGFASGGDGDPSSNTPEAVYSRKNFGWVKLKATFVDDDTPAAFEYLGSAVSYGQGIVIGTTTAVPEPTSGALSVVALAVGLRRARGPLFKKKR